jgi:hypothetical protein
MGLKSILLQSKQSSQERTPSMPSTDNTRLLILWTSGDPLTARDMILLYAVNAIKHNWWSAVTLLVWGAADSLAAQNNDIQAEIRRAIDAGVRIIACKKCAEDQNVAAILEHLGIEVFYTGEFLTEWLKSGSKILSV